jgi:hypothetical protein
MNQRYHDIAEILLQLASNTNLSFSQSYKQNLDLTRLKENFVLILIGHDSKNFILLLRKILLHVKKISKFKNRKIWQENVIMKF